MRRPFASSALSACSSPLSCIVLRTMVIDLRDFADGHIRPDVYVHLTNDKRLAALTAV